MMEYFMQNFIKQNEKRKYMKQKQKSKANGSGT